MNALTHSQVHTAGNLAAPGASAGLQERLQAHHHATVLRASCISESLRLISEYAGPDDVPMFLRALANAIRPKNHQLAEVLDEVADEVEA